MLGQWEDLSSDITEKYEDDILTHPEKLGENTMRLLFVSLLHQDQHWSSLSELFKTWSENREGSNMLRGSLAY